MEADLKNNCPRPDSFTLGEIGAHIGAEIKGNHELRVFGIGPLESASSDELSFVTDTRNSRLVGESRAAALIVPPSLRDLERDLLVTENPYLAMARVVALFLGPCRDEFVVHPSAIVGAGVEFGRIAVGPYSCIGDNSRIGAGTRIGGGCHIGRDVRIGEDCTIGPRVTIMERCVLGNRVIVHSGVVIGADGFGYAPDSMNRFVKIPQTGIVQIDDDVEIGANSTIDRATFGKTWIKRGTKIDNLVMIAHNVVIGEDCGLAGLVGVSGSTLVGNHVVMGGQAGIAGHLEIGDGAKVAAKTGIMRDIKPGQIIAGTPGVPHDEFFRNLAHVRRIPQFREELRRLNERLSQLEEELKKA